MHLLVLSFFLVFIYSFLLEKLLWGQAAEFGDPLRYIASIRAEAEQFGICKVVPPPEVCPLVAFNLKK